MFDEQTMNRYARDDERPYEAHDLLRLRSLPSADGMPSWVPSAFADAPFAVVRRAQAPGGCVAIGFRGPGRGQRHGTFAARDAIECVLSPEQLSRRPIPVERRDLKVFRALRVLIEEGRLDSHVWGPTGSVGYELAAAKPTASDTSDLDLLIRAPLPLSRERARTLRDYLRTVETRVGPRIDAQLETPAGGIALSEWADDKPHVMVRAASGPSLIDDPWASIGARCEVLR